MTRKERQRRAQEKCLKIQQEAWKIFLKKWEETKDWNLAVRACGKYLNDLANQKPQEKALIRRADNELAEKIKDALERMKESENA